MVSKEIIEKIFEKSIEEAIFKCPTSDGLNLSTNVINAFNSFGEKYRNSNHENLQLITNNGEVVFTDENGTSKNVKNPIGEAKELFVEYGELNIAHNHPSSLSPYIPTCLSVSDMHNFAKTNPSNNPVSSEDGDFLYHSIMAEGSNGSRMTMVKGRKFKDENKDKVYKLAEDLSKAYGDYMKKWNKEYVGIYFSYMGNPNAKDLASKETVTKIGEFEDTEGFKKVQKDLSELDINLTLTWSNV